MAEPHSVFSPGLIDAVTRHAKATGGSIAAIARTAGVADAVLRKKGKTANTTSHKSFDKLLKVVPVLWTRSYCNLDERPSCLGKLKTEQVEDIEVFRYQAIPTPNLDAFAALEGSWC